MLAQPGFPSHLPVFGVDTRVAHQCRGSAEALGCSDTSVPGGRLPVAKAEPEGFQVDGREAQWWGRTPPHPCQEQQFRGSDLLAASLLSGTVPCGCPEGSPARGDT